MPSLPLPPHPLVAALAEELIPPPAARAPVGQAVTERVTALAKDSEAPGLVMFAGYVGATLTDPQNPAKNWVVLYLDAKLQTWLVVQEDGIALHERMKDEKSPKEKRDVLWVKRDAFVTKGTTPPSPEKRFLRGDLVRADDFSASLMAPTLSSATGVFCEADTIGCCKKATW